MEGVRVRGRSGFTPDTPPPRPPRPLPPDARSSECSNLQPIGEQTRPSPTCSGLRWLLPTQSGLSAHKKQTENVPASCFFFSLHAHFLNLVLILNPLFFLPVDPFMTNLAHPHTFARVTTGWQHRHAKTFESISSSLNNQ